MIREISLASLLLMSEKHTHEVHAANACCDTTSDADGIARLASGDVTAASRRFFVSGLDCIEEVRVLRRVLEPLARREIT